jgi:hypothetical protein
MLGRSSSLLLTCRPASFFFALAKPTTSFGFPTKGPTPSALITCRYYPSYSPASASASSVSSTCRCSVDLSEYLLNGSDPNKAPKISDFIGPLRIGRTSDGRGRGLFLTRDVSMGDILIASNAFSAAYDDENNEKMYAKVAAIVKGSPRAIRQLYSLAGGPSLTNSRASDVPKIELFDPTIPDVELFDPAEKIAFDDARITHIIQTNSFSGKMGVAGVQRNGPETKINALWLLPSFINHSCSPNTSRLLVGEIMVFVAAKDMKAREEITICYTDCMVPLRKREGVLERTGGGFHCKCKRCSLERSVDEELRDITDAYLEHYDKAAEEVYSVATTRAQGSFSSSKELALVFDRLKKKLDTLEILSKQEKRWILGGYSNGFLANFLTLGYTQDFNEPDRFANSMAMEVVIAMQETVPGFLRTLTLAVMLATISTKPDYRSVMVQLAMDESVRLYGKQRPDVIKHMALQAIELVPFF